MGLNTSAKGFDPCQPAQFAQADINETFLRLVNFLNVLVQVYTMVQLLKKLDFVDLMCSCNAFFGIFNTGSSDFLSWRLGL